jgi:hypothetical protein
MSSPSSVPTSPGSTLALLESVAAGERAEHQSLPTE